MASINNEAYTISKELYDEFNKIELEYKIKYDNNLSLLEEIDGNIAIFKNNEDVDFKVFSPRNLVSSNHEKIKNLYAEKEKLEIENNELLKQIKYYSERTNKLSRLLDILNNRSINNDNGIKLTKSGKSKELFFDNNENVSSDINSEEKSVDYKSDINENKEYEDDIMKILFGSIDDNNSTEIKESQNIDSDNSNSDDINTDKSDKNSNESPDNNEVIIIDTDDNSSKIDMNSIIHKLSLCLKFIDMDPNRAKSNIRSIIKILQK